MQYTQQSHQEATATAWVRDGVHGVRRWEAITYMGKLKEHFRAILRRCQEKLSETRHLRDLGIKLENMKKLDHKKCSYSHNLPRSVIDAGSIRKIRLSPCPQKSCDPT